MVTPKGWKGKTTKPKTKGVYHTSTVGRVKLGGAQSFWDGKTWKTFETWGKFHDCSDFIWHGDGPKRDKPIKDAV